MAHTHSFDPKNGILAHHLMRELIGLVPVTGGKKVRITFSGNGAFVNFKASHVNLPALPNLSVIPMDVAREIRGFAAHEAAHIVFSDPDILHNMVAKKNFKPLLKEIWNSVEDYMIEREWMKIYPGARKNFASTEARCSKAYLKSAAGNPDIAKDLRGIAPVAITWMRAIEFGIAEQPTLDAVKTLPDGLRKRVETWQTWMQYVASSADCLKVADRILNEIEENPIDPQDPPNAKKQDKPQEKFENGKSDKDENGGDQDSPENEGSSPGEKGDGQGQPGQDQPQKDQTGENGVGAGQAGKSGDTESKSGQEGCDQAKKAASGEEQSEEKAPGGEKSERGDSGQKAGEDKSGSGKGDAEDAAEKKNQSESGDEKGESGGGQKSDGAGEEKGETESATDPRGDALKKDDKDEEEGKKAKDGEEQGPEKDGPNNEGGILMESPIGGTEDWKKQNEKEKEAIEAAKNTPAPEIHIRPANIDTVIDAAVEKAEKFVELEEKDFESVDQIFGNNRVQEGKSNTAIIRKNIGSVTGQIANGLRRALKAQARTKIKGGRQDGMLDPRALSKAVTGCHEIYNKRTEKRDHDTAMTLLIDMSGSMSGERIKICQQMCIVISDALRGSDVKIEILGYSCGRPLFSIKTFDESYSAPESRMGLVHLLPGGGTGTGEAILEAGRRLMERSEKRKVMLVLTDGAANNHIFARAAASFIHNNGVTVFGIGIGSSSDISTFPNGERILNIQDLSRVLLGHLVRILIGERDKVVRGRVPGRTQIGKMSWT